METRQLVKYVQSPIVLSQRQCSLSAREAGRRAGAGQTEKLFVGVLEMAKIEVRGPCPKCKKEKKLYKDGYCYRCYRWEKNFQALKTFVEVNGRLPRRSSRS